MGGLRLLPVLALLFLAGCASTGGGAVGEPLLADRVGLLKPVVSQSLTNQAQLGINSAIHVLGQQALAASGDDSILNSGYLLSSFAIDQQSSETLREALQQQLNESPYAGSADDEVDLMLYALISWQPTSSDDGLLEVVIALADWPGMKAMAGKPADEIFLANTRWLAVSRKQLSRDQAEVDGAASIEQLLPYVTELGTKAITLLPEPATL